MVGDDDPSFPRNTKQLAQDETTCGVEGFQPSANGSVPVTKLAAGWLYLNRKAVSGPVIPTLRSRFGLTILDAIEAAKLAHALEYSGEGR